MRYELLDRLAIGGMGEVFLARRIDDGRVLVVKTVPDNAPPDAAARLIHEADMAGSLRHEHIVAVDEVGLRAGRPFLALEYVHGASVAQLFRRAVARGTLLPLEVAVRVTLDGARAVAFSHDAGVVHRDVTPRNLLVREDGVCKLTDFGIAHAVGAQAPERAGTLPYMAPELWDHGAPGTGADQFALGVVLWELLTGARLFRSTDPAAIERASLSASEAPSRRRQDVPAALDEAVLRMLQRKPAARYPDMHAVVRALELAVPAATSPACRARVAEQLTLLCADDLAARERALSADEDDRPAITPSEGPDPTPVTSTQTVPLLPAVVLRRRALRRAARVALATMLLAGAVAAVAAALW